MYHTETKLIKYIFLCNIICCPRNDTLNAIRPLNHRYEIMPYKLQTTLNLHKTHHEARKNLVYFCLFCKVCSLNVFFGRYKANIRNDSDS